MTLQEIFDIAVPKVIAQGVPSSGGDGFCLYRRNRHAEDPVRCAVGHLIPDQLYDPSFEGRTLEDVVHMSGIDADTQALRWLQKCHDEASAAPDFVEHFRNNCRKFAEAYNLDTKVLANA